MKLTLALAIAGASASNMHHKPASNGAVFETREVLWEKHMNATLHSLGLLGTVRADLMVAANALYADRAHEHYTEGGERWSGISGRVHPPNAPPYSDCSSAVTWIYWTAIGSGPDIINGEHWTAGYTGTMVGRGKEVSVAEALPGDLVFYGAKGQIPFHVAMWVGNEEVVSHGEDPVSRFRYDAMSPVQQIRNYLG